MTKKQKNNKRIVGNNVGFFKRMRNAWTKGWQHGRKHIADNVEQAVVDTIAEYKYHVECKLDKSVVIRHAYAVCMTAWYVMQYMWVVVVAHVCALYKRIRKDK